MTTDRSIAEKRVGAGADVAPTAAQLAEAIATIASAVATTRTSEPADGLVRIEAKALAAHGLELRAIRALERDGRLKTVVIGRCRYTTVRRLINLVDELPAASIAERTSIRERDTKPAKSDLEIAVERAATRRARRSVTPVQVRESALGHRPSAPKSSAPVSIAERARSLTKRSTGERHPLADAGRRR